MAVCTCLAETYLKLLNGGVALLALIAMIYAAIIASNLSDFSSVAGEFTIVAPAIGAAIVFLVSMLGFFATVKKNKCLLFVYVILAGMFTLMVLGTGAALLSFSDQLDDIQNGQVIDAGEEVQANVQDVELAVFQVCCVEEFGATPPVLCGEEPTVGCINDEDVFNEAVDAIGDSETICNALADFEVDGVPVVGEIADGSCGGGDAAAFLQGINQFVQENFETMGAGVVALSVVMLLDVLATCILMCTNKDKWDKKEEKEEVQEAEYVPADRNGQSIAA